MKQMQQYSSSQCAVELFRNGHPSERQPYIKVTVGHLQLGVSLDSCCAANGAMCEENIVKLRMAHPDLFKSTVLALRHFASPVPVKGVDGPSACTIVGEAKIRVGPGPKGASSPSWSRSCARAALVMPGQ